jgi:proline dehydrogenase
MGFLGSVTRALLPLAPKIVARPVGLRYVAGETLDDALQTVAELDEEDALATVDVLGVERAARAVDEYGRLVEALARAAPASTISIKPTLVGLAIGEDVARRNLEAVVSSAVRSGIGVQIDMEDHSTTDATLALYDELQRRHGDVGVALQARLKRTVEDVERMNLRGPVRLCKGIYLEPEEIAYVDAEEIRQSYVRILAKLLDAGAYVGVATHDDALLERSLELVAAHGLDAERYEVQMLLGVRAGRRRELVSEGHRVRVYVPYGEDWYAYSMRRLAENPTVMRHVVTSMLRRE